MRSPRGDARLEVFVCRGGFPLVLRIFLQQILEVLRVDFAHDSLEREDVGLAVLTLKDDIPKGIHCADFVQDIAAPVDGVANGWDVVSQLPSTEETGYLHVVVHVQSSKSSVLTFMSMLTSSIRKALASGSRENSATTPRHDLVTAHGNDSGHQSTTPGSA